jgi:hypothetical protein
MARKKVALSLLGIAALLISGCSGIKGGSTSGGGTGGGTGGGGTGGGGTGAGPFTVGGTVIGLSGTGLILENNGTDDLTVTGTGTFTFTFKNKVTGNYKVIIKQEPSTPTQNCSVTNGTGTATATVTNIQITCVPVFTVGGSVSGLAGTGLVLANNATDTVKVTGTGNVNFTFPTPLASGATYAVTITTQPTNPPQTCQIVNGSGTVSSNVTTIAIVCPQATFTIGGTLIGLVDGPGNTVELINNGGDNTFVTGNNTTFTFPSQVTANGAYNVQVFVDPTSQPQPCWVFFYKGVATANVSSVLVDCQHNDWTWRSGPLTGDNLGSVTLPPGIQSKNSPGGRDYAAAWTDNLGRKWMFGGFGLELSGKTPPDLPGLLNDLWLFDGTNGGWIPANLSVTTTDAAGTVVNTPLPKVCSHCSSVADLTALERTNVPGSTATPSEGTGPGGRWGSVTWTDASGSLWLFGGQGITTVNSFGVASSGLLNDIWKWTADSYDVSVPLQTYTGSYTYTGTWTPVVNTANVNQGGTYGTLGTPGGFPGGRWGAGFCTDKSGNVWMFGGQGMDSTGTLGLLNDLWKYNIASQQWTWMGPTNSNVGQHNGVYGTQGTPGAANAAGPGGRQTAVVWSDNSGNIWVFGGLGLDSIGTRNSGSLNGGLPPGVTPNGALLNDLWKFNIATGQWTWVSGGGASGLANLNGVYGTQLTAAAGNVPGSRWSASGWSDSNGNLWFFGGWGYGSTLAQSTGYLNDVWEFHPATGEWVWWKGASDVNQNGSYPTQFNPSYNVPFTGNTPGGRRGVAFWQQDSLDYVWVFGGQGYDSTSTTGNGLLNDFWSYLGYPN